MLQYISGLNIWWGTFCIISLSSRYMVRWDLTFAVLWWSISPHFIECQISSPYGTSWMLFYICFVSCIVYVCMNNFACYWFVLAFNVCLFCCCLLEIGLPKVVLVWIFRLCFFYWWLVACVASWDLVQYQLIFIWLDIDWLYLTCFGHTLLWLFVGSLSGFSLYCD